MLSLLFLSSVLYVLNFPFNLLSISKIIRFLNCSVIFFVTREFQELETRKTIGTRRKCGGLYYLNLDPKLVACYSSVYAFGHHCKLGLPSLSILKF